LATRIPFESGAIIPVASSMSPIVSEKSSG
jgi:hypothetical protein